MGVRSSLAATRFIGSVLDLLMSLENNCENHLLLEVANSFGTPPFPAQPYKFKHLAYV
jgi:hypothetical protein